jgi:hypothetical protein
MHGIAMSVNGDFASLWKHANFDHLSSWNRWTDLVKILPFDYVASLNKFYNLVVIARLGSAPHIREIYAFVLTHVCLFLFFHAEVAPQVRISRMMAQNDWICRYDVPVEG